MLKGLMSRFSSNMDEDELNRLASKLSEDDKDKEGSYPENDEPESGEDEDKESSYPENDEPTSEGDDKDEDKAKVDDKDKAEGDDKDKAEGDDKDKEGKSSSKSASSILAVERKRIAAIMRSPLAEGREATAYQMAFETNLSVAEAEGLLKVTPKAGVSDRKQKFQSAMEKSAPNPRIATSNKSATNEEIDGLRAAATEMGVI